MIPNLKNCIGLGVQTQLELRTLNWMGWGGSIGPFSSITFLEVQPSMTSFTLKLPVMQQSLGCLAVLCFVFSQDRFSIILMVPGFYASWSCCQNHLDAEKREISWNLKGVDFEGTDLEVPSLGDGLKSIHVSKTSVIKAVKCCTTLKDLWRQSELPLSIQQLQPGKSDIDWSRVDSCYLIRQTTIFWWSPSVAAHRTMVLFPRHWLWPWLSLEVLPAAAGTACRWTPPGCPALCVGPGHRCHWAMDGLCSRFSGTDFSILGWEDHQS